MKRLPAALVALLIGAVTLVGCVAAQIPESVTPTAITVPDELTPTNVPDTLQSNDRACAASWPRLDAAFVTYDAAVLALAREVTVDVDPENPHNVDPKSPGAADYFVELSALTAATSAELTAIGADVDNTPVADLLTELGAVYSTRASLLAALFDAATANDALLKAQNTLLDEAVLLVDYTSMCGAVVSGTTTS